MKKTLAIILLALGVSTVSMAQDYKPFQLYFGLGFASPGAGGVGVLVDFEPSYRINDQIAVGFRLESAAMAKEVTVGVDSEISAVGSYTLNGRYYFGDSNFRPYVGAGFGLYSLGTVEADIDGGDVEADFGTKFGFYPRIGFDFGHFNMNLDYNLIPKYDENGADVKNSYLGIRIGFFLFGGKN
ncbi:MAG: outer membrane beta-barrel protein [Reichenbachiella sp.]|uniref:outer membrane beta-barrel protein n=1 Tax=Reichenbachiella sp. TaxID=2184521 RepID=UPI0029668678|nr:outer membrane beta-barrel protein [Reichenbachiella sp.]MDW3209141.1 outer membrane beta-barrel protein [Reichenbachiella sp.]